MASSTPVRDFYSGRSLLITGASGFLGKVLVEKLLRSIPELDNVYLLIRPQNGLDAKQRLDKITQSNLFDQLRTNWPERLAKLIPISGNLMEPELALSQPDLHRLCDHVSVVIHCAATVKFDEVLRISVEMNVLGTQRLIAICHKMRHLVSVVHASTAYANCDRSRILESVYPPAVQPSKLIDALEWMSDDMVNDMTPRLLGRRPNTYTLTKSLAEVQLVEDSGRLPVVIVRPSIIGCVKSDPVPGWTDNLNGPTGIIAAVAKGVLTNMCGSAESTADIVPVDTVSNLMIVAAWHRAVNVQDENIPVIHCCSGRLNPIQWGTLVTYLEVFFREYPLKQCLRMPSTQFNSNRTMFRASWLLKHKLPAYIIDLYARLTGNKPRYVRLYDKVWKVVETLHYFTVRGWDFQSKGMVDMWEQMTPEDREAFDFDVRQINWDEYLFDYMFGVRKFILKEDLADLPVAKANLRRIKLMGTAVNLGTWALLVRWFSSKRPRNQQLVFWLCGSALTHFAMNFGRPHFKLPDVTKSKLTDDATPVKQLLEK